MKKFVRFSLQNIGAITGPLLIILLLCISDDLHARVGGGGGSSSGGGDGDILGLAIYILYMIPFPWNLVVLAVIILLFILARKKARQQTILNRLPTGHGIKKARGYENFMAGNPAFNEEEFKKNVGDSFVQIQEAWQNKDMSKVRKYISDGMYQRLNTQFKMMKLLDQKNVIENLKVKNVYIDKVQSDGSYDIIHVAIHAAITDRFVSEKYSSLNQTFHEEFVEYWSFIKKRGADDKDLWHTNNCPNCGGELSKDGGEVCKCPSCGVMTNNPEFGWVLSEITQADDYITADPMVVKTENLKDKIKEMIHDNDDFSVQLIEDKASNGYLQVETARVMNDPKIMRRFVTDAAFDKLSKGFTNDRLVYNRLFLNDVTLIGIGEKDNKNLLMISLKVSFQRVRPGEKKAEIIDPVVTSKTEVVLMSRDKDAGVSKGSIYQHTCPSCSGSVSDSLDTRCPYCGNELNSGKNEWIIEDVMNMQEYYAFYSANAAAFYTPVKPEKMDILYKVRDYAFNNVLIMIATDGVFDNEEIEYANRLAKKWGYSTDKIQPMLQMAGSGKLVLRMPENPKQRRRIYELMEKAAKIDGNVSPEEQALLDDIKGKYLV